MAEKDLLHRSGNKVITNATTEMPKGSEMTFRLVATLDVALLVFQMYLYGSSNVL